MAGVNVTNLICKTPVSRFSTPLCLSRFNIKLQENANTRLWVPLLVQITLCLRLLDDEAFDNPLQ